MEFILKKEVNIALDRLSNNGYQAYVVGGCIRNHFLKLPIEDYDITTNATPTQMQELFIDYQIIEKGIKHGTLEIIIDGLHIEITTFRLEKDYINHRHPKNVDFTMSLEEDLKRRDFTMNALAYNPTIGLIDLFKGRNDIYAHQIVCIGNPATRFNEDALRIMRALRFCATLDFNIENSTLSAMKQCKEYLKDVSGERLFNELQLMLCGDYVGSTLRKHHEILDPIIPELSKMVGFDQNSPFHIYDVFEHTIATIEAMEKDPLLRFTMLLHDMGKPETYSKDNSGCGHFFNHGEICSYRAKNICKRFKLSNKDTESVVTLIKYHDYPFTAARKDVINMLFLIGEENFVRLMKVKRADNLGKNPVFNHQSEFDLIDESYHEIINNKICFKLEHLVINGTDLQNLGFIGKDIGIVLDNTLNAVMNEEVENDLETLFQYVLINRESLINQATILNTDIL